nr:uncharacterized protein LOC109153434 [Ipomoea batatas]
MKSLDKFGVDLEAGECGDGGLRNSTAVSGVRRPCSSEAMEVGNTEVSGVPPEKMIYSMSHQEEVSPHPHHLVSSSTFTLTWLKSVAETLSLIFLPLFSSFGPHFWDKSSRLSIPPMGNNNLKMPFSNGVVLGEFLPSLWLTKYDLGNHGPYVNLRHFSSLGPQRQATLGQIPSMPSNKLQGKPLHVAEI